MIEKSFLSPLALILLGAPGSGKGTQARRLSQEYQIPHISTGDLFRAHIAARTSLGGQVADLIQAGQLVPDEVVLRMLFDRLMQLDCANGYLLDGFPRTIEQANQLAYFQENKVRTFVLYLEVPDEEIVRRATGRLICRQCGLIYNRDLSPPVYEGICDKCGGEVYQRLDDQPAIVWQRLKVYHEQTQPLIKYYTQKHLLKAFNGNQPPDVLHGQLRRYIDQS